MAEAIVIIPFKELIYFAGIIYVAFYVVRNNAQNNNFWMYYVSFLAVCFLSSIMAFTIDYRLFAFTFLIFV